MLGGPASIVFTTARLRMYKYYSLVRDISGPSKQAFLCFPSLPSLSFTSFLSLNVLPGHPGSSFSAELTESVTSLISVSFLVFNFSLLFCYQKKKKEIKSHQVGYPNLSLL